MKGFCSSVRDSCRRASFWVNLMLPSALRVLDVTLRVPLQINVHYQALELGEARDHVSSAGLLACNLFQE